MELDNRELERLKKLVPYKVLAPTPDEICEEIERLKEENKKYNKWVESLNKDNHRLQNKIKEVREYIEKNMEDEYKYDGLLYKNEDKEKLLEILDKGSE